jgi:hypothetical protein
LLFAGLLLVRFALDFTAEASLLLAGPFWALVLAALAVGLSNLIGGPRSNPLPKLTRIFLLAAMPLAFFASSLDCTGLSVMGCSPFCTFVKTIWIPLIVIACAVYFCTEREWLLLLISLMAFVPLVPHCVCYNAGNGWWIERIGASPVCYAWGFVVSVMSVSALRSSRSAWPTLLISGAIIGGALSFFVAHHYFHFPW